MKNYYEILQVNKTADKEIIQKVYKILTKKYHPDLQQNAEDREYAEKAMAKINEAYEILSDDEKRKQYDYELEQDEQRKLEKEIRKYIDRLNQYSEESMSYQSQSSIQQNTRTNTGYNQSYNNNTNYTPGYSRYVSYGSSRKSQKKRKKFVATIMDLVISFCILAGILFILYFARQFLSFITFS